MDLEQKVEELAEEVEKLRKENKQIKKENKHIKHQHTQTKEKQGEETEQKISRRGFLKKAGAGIAGLGALSLLPASAVNIRSQSLDFYGTDNTKELTISENGPVKIPNKNLQLTTGQSIEDGSGINRMEFLSNYTKVNDQEGNAKLELSAHDRDWLRVGYGGWQFTVNDEEGGFKAWQYIPSPTAPGTLELTNADMVIRAKNETPLSVQTTGGSVNIKDETAIASATGPVLEWFNNAATNTRGYIFEKDGELIAEDNGGNTTQITP